MAAGVADKPSGKTQLASSSISFSIPLTSTRKIGAVVSNSAKTMTFTAKPQFIDGGALTTGGAVLQVYLDGQKITSITGFAGAPVGAGPSGGPTTTPDGGSVSWTSQVTATAINVTMNLSTLSGIQHTFGVVETNGPCVGTDPCLGDGSGTAQSYGPGINNGYVLAEGQTTFTLTTGDNPGVNLTLKGVIEGGFICWNSNCDDSTPLTAGIPVTAFPVDENGNAVSDSTYSNGWWEVEELDGKGLVQINTTNPQPYNAPNMNAHGWDAEPFTITCLGTGDATIGMRMVPNDSTSKGPVTGFPYTNKNYPAAGALLGHTGSDLYWGNGDGVVIHCETYGSAPVTVN